ncbi:MAG: hypothetical protein AAFV88_23650 [Planctomycetota bacterium]
MSTPPPLFRLPALKIRTSWAEVLRFDPGDKVASPPVAVREPAAGNFAAEPKRGPGFPEHAENLLRELSEWSIRLDQRESELGHRETQLMIDERLARQSARQADEDSNE